MEPLLGQIIMFGGNFAPRGWAFCNGQLLDIASNSALFSLLGTIYGGDGRTTFALPDLRGRVPMHWGNGAGLTNRPQGLRSGSETNTLNVANLPAHGHSVSIPAKLEADTEIPTDHYIAGAGFNGFGTTNDTQLMGTTSGNVGSNVPVNNMQPFTTISFIIALVGVYPSRN